MILIHLTIPVVAKLISPPNGYMYLDIPTADIYFSHMD